MLLLRQTINKPTHTWVVFSAKEKSNRRAKGGGGSVGIVIYSTLTRSSCGKGRKKPAVSHEYGKAEGTARTRVLRWDALEPSQARSLG